MTRSIAARAFRIDVTTDYRAADATLQDTAAPLTLVKPLPATTPTDQSFPAAARELRRLLRDELLSGQGAGATTPPQAGSVLINLEQLVEEPWLGGAQYSPLGAIDCAAGPRQPYLLELTPVLSGEGLTLRLKHTDSEEVRPLVREMADGFAKELEAVLTEGERYASAREFWHAELEQGTPQPNIEVLAGEGVGDGGSWRAVRCGVSGQTLERLAARCGADADAVLVSALGVLLSRLNGRQRVDLLTTFGGGDTALVPLRLDARWALGFDEFARGVGHKMTLARQHGAHVSEFTDGAEAHTGGASYAFDVAYLHGPAGGRAAESLRGLPMGGGLAFALSAGGGGDLSVQTHGDTARLSLPTLEKMSSYLETIINEVDSNAGVTLGDITLDRAAHVVDPSLTLARDAFSFG